LFITPVGMIKSVKCHSAHPLHVGIMARGLLSRAALVVRISKIQTQVADILSISSVSAFQFAIVDIFSV